MKPSVDKVIPAVGVFLSVSSVTCRASFYRIKCPLLTVFRYHSRCPRSNHRHTQTRSVHHRCQPAAAATQHAGQTVQSKHMHMHTEVKVRFFTPLLTRNRNSMLYNLGRGSRLARINGAAAQMRPFTARANGQLDLR